MATNRFDKTVSFIEKYLYLFFLYCLVPSSILFTESTSINSYFINIIQVILIICFCIKNSLNREKIIFNFIDLLLISLLILSVISCYVANGIVLKTAHISFLLYFILLILSRPVVTKLNYTIGISYTIIFVNIYTLLCIVVQYINNIDYILYINKHFSNTGIYAIFLTLSCIILYNIVHTLKVKKWMIFISIFIFIVNVFIIIHLKSRISFFVLFCFILYHILNKINLNKKLYRIIILILPLFIFISLLHFKKASSEGRLFILKTSLAIIEDNILIGTGGFNSFPASYPHYQAEYFMSDLGTLEEIMNADNTKTALNELIQLVCELGGGAIIVIIIFLLRTRFLLKIAKDEFLKNIFWIIMFMSCFYYILHITLFQNILFLVLMCVSSKESRYIKILIQKSISVYIMLFIGCIALLPHTISHFQKAIEIEHIISRKQSLLKYADILQNSFDDNSYFLGAYVFELYYKRQDKECERMLSILDKNIIYSEVELIKGKLYLRNNDSIKAKKHLIQASNICPNRFTYRYELFKVYLEEGNINLAKKVAVKIDNLPEKIPSPTTLAIKENIKRFIDSTQHYHVNCEKTFFKKYDLSDQK